MGRSTRKARKALEARQTRDVVRDRNRITNSLGSPSLPPVPNIPQTLKELRMETQAGQFQERTQLMSEKSTFIVDLTNVDTARLAKENRSRMLPDRGRKFNVYLCTGFYGYSKQTTGAWRTITLDRIGNSYKFEVFANRTLQYQMNRMGLADTDVEISGFEIRFPRDFIFNGMTISAGEPVLIRSGDILLAWAYQLLDHGKTEQHEIVMRISKSDGARFDATFRTPRDIVPIPIKRGISDEPGTREVQYKFKSLNQILKKERKRHARREVAKSLPRKGARHDTLARREKVAQKAHLRLDTMVMERLMAKQHLSEDDTDEPVTRSSSVPIDVLERGVDTEHMADQTGDEAMVGTDFDMAG